MAENPSTTSPSLACCPFCGSGDISVPMIRETRALICGTSLIEVHDDGTMRRIDPQATLAHLK